MFGIGKPVTLRASSAECPAQPTGVAALPEMTMPTSLIAAVVPIQAMMHVHTRTHKSRKVTLRQPK